MESSGNAGYGRFSSQQLEDILRRSTDPAEKSAITEELTRRYSDQYLGEAPKEAASAPPPPPFSGRRTAAPPPPPSDQRAAAPPPWQAPPPQPPPQAAAGRPPTAGRLPRRRRTVWILVAIVAAVVIIVAATHSNGPSGSGQQTGSTCVTPFGSCPLAEAGPVGASCFCPSASGPVTGTVQ